MSRKTSIFTVLSILLFSVLVPATQPARAQEMPVIEAYITADRVVAWGYEDTAITARLEVYAPGGNLPKCTGDFLLAEGQPWLECPEAHVQPEDQVLLYIDGFQIKDLLVLDLSINVFDPEAGLFAGKAPPGEIVLLDGCNSEIDCFHGEDLVGEDGSWEISFGPDNVSPDAWYGAYISDEDSDRTYAEYIPPPNINANISGDWVSAWGFGPDDLSARLEVYEIYEQGDPYLKCEGDFDLSEDDPWLDCWEATILPGDLVVLKIDGTAVKEHTVFALTLDVFDPGQGLFSGTSLQGTTVRVDGCNPPCGDEDGFSYESLLVTDGTWEISFEPGEVSPDAWFGAFIVDDDGDQTMAEIPPPQEPPVMDVNVSGDWVSAWGFGPNDLSARLEVYEIYEQGDPYLKCEGDFDLSEGDPWLGCWEATILPGDLVVLKVDGTAVKDHIVFDLTLDIVDIEGGNFEGTAPEWSTVRVDVCNPPFEECSSLEYDTEENTIWAISFGSGAVDPEAWFGAFMMDDDSDQTMAELIYEQLPNIDYNLIYNWLGLNGFPPDAEVLVQIFTNGETITETLYTNSHGGSGWDTMLSLSPGDVIVATYGDDEIVKDLVLENLTLDYFDLEGDQAGGFATDGTEVFYVLEGGEVEYLEDRVTADSSGWFVDFAFTHEIDLTEEMSIFVYVEDDDGDWTMAVLAEPLSPASIRAYPEFDTIEATGFPFGETITLVIDDDLNPDNGNLYFDTGVAIEAPWSPDESWVSFYVGETLDLQPDHYVILFFEDIFQVHQVTNLTITNIDLDAKVITGTAEPFSGLFLLVNWGEETFVFTSADDNGNWMVNYTGIAPLSHGDLVIAGQPDSEGNTTLVSRIIVTPGGLIDEIINLPEEELAPEIKNSIIKKIENGHNSFLKGNTYAAIVKLEALLNQIEALRGNKISEETADHLNQLVWIIIRSFE